MPSDKVPEMGRKPTDPKAPIIDAEVLPPLNSFESRCNIAIGGVHGFRILIESGWLGHVKINKDLKNLLLSQLDILEKTLKGE